MKTILSLIGLATLVVGGIFGKKAWDKYQLKKGVDEANNNSGSGGGTTGNNSGGVGTNATQPTAAELAQQKRLQDLQFTKFMRINRDYLQLEYTGAKNLLHDNPTYIKYNNLAAERNKAIEDANTLKVVLPNSLIYENKQKEILDLSLQIKESLMALKALNPVITTQGNSFFPTIILPNPNYVNNYNQLIDKINNLKAQRTSAYNILRDNKVLLAPIVLTALDLAKTFSASKAELQISAMPSKGHVNFDGIGKKSNIY